jgi:hypothetical protein
MPLSPLPSPAGQVAPAEEGGGGHHGQVCCWLLVKVGPQRSNLDNMILNRKSTVVKYYLYLHVCVFGRNKITKRGAKKYRSQSEKNVSKGSFVYLHICTRAKKITA